MRKAKITVAIIAMVVISGFTYLAISSGVTAKNLDLKTIKLQSTEEKLDGVNLQVEKLKTQSSNDKAKQEQLEKEKKSLEAKLQVKANAKAKLELAAAQAEQKLTATRTAAAVSASIPSGSHNDWMAAAGISSKDYGYANFIIMHECSYDPCVVNGGAHDCSYATNGGQRAYGVCQALPGSKMASAGADWATNPITQLKWCNSYAQGKGGWAASYNFWISHNWW
jgi:hypothetical protein